MRSRPTVLKSVLAQNSRRTMKHKNRIYKRYKPSNNFSTKHFAISHYHQLELSMQNHKVKMHDLQLLFSRLTIGDDLMNCDEPQPSPFPPPVINPGLFIVPQLPKLFFAGPVNQGMVQQAPSRAPSWGPSRHQRHAGSIGSHEAEALYQNKFVIHESSGTITRDRSTSTHPGMARMDANNSGAEKVWRTPSRNP